MKRYLVVGLGNFGSTLARRLHEMGHDVAAVDMSGELVDAIGPKVARALVGDGTSRRVLQEAGAEKADAAIISTGDHLAASVLSLLALHDLGVKEVYVKVISDDHARIVEALGATGSVFPERESALALASRVTSGELLQYVQLGRDLALQEMPLPRVWTGKTLRELALPVTHRVQVVAVHDMLQDKMLVVPDPDRKLTDSDTMIVAGLPEALEKLVALD